MPKRVFKARNLIILLLLFSCTLIRPNLQRFLRFGKIGRLFTPILGYGLKLRWMCVLSRMRHLWFSRIINTSL